MSSKPRLDPEALCRQRFFQSLHNARQLSDSPVERWVIAHSGGLDSQVLLSLAAASLPADRLQVLHINHQLQDAAEDWAAFSCAEADRLNLSCHVVAVEPGSDSEDAARQARYDAFAGYLQAGDCLLLAQHADDQAETLLFRMLRGTGLTGLAGMPQSRPIGKALLLRPLLDLTRQQLEVYARQHQLNYIEDPSNLDIRYSRNFLRHQVLPLLRGRWPELSRQLSRLARHSCQQTQLLNGYLDRDLGNLMGTDQSLQLPPLRQFSELQQQALLRRWLECAAGIAVNNRQLEQLVQDLIEAADDAQPLFRLSGIELRRYQQRIYIVSDESQQRVESLEITGPGVLDLGDGQLSITASGPGLKQLAGIQVRRRQGGERCRPAGRGCSVSVKNLLHDAGIPPWLRANWPLLYLGDELVAVPDICVCENWYSPDGGFSVNWLRKAE